MSILLAYPQGVVASVLALLCLAYSVNFARRLRRTFTTWRDGMLLAQVAVILGVAALSLAVLDLRGSGLLTVLAYHHDQSAVRDVFAGLHSTPITKARAAALLKEVRGFKTVSRPNLAPAPPAVTEAIQAGTSLDQALWLLARLDNSAAILVVGEDRAWVEGADVNGVKWIFDPAERQPTSQAARLGSRYLARMVWNGTGFAKVGERQPQAFGEARVAAAQLN